MVKVNSRGETDDAVVSLDLSAEAQITAATGLPDPETLLARLAGLHRTARARHAAGRLELYHRATFAIRATARAAADSVELRMGGDEGLAVRMKRDERSPSTFAAASGGNESAMVWALERVLAAEPPARSEKSHEWPLHAETSRFDLDSAEAFPDPSDLVDWIERAGQALAAVPRRGAMPERVESWVEVARTVESWVGDAGVAASRSRMRSWAMLQLRPKGRDVAVLQVAGRSWESLPHEAWALGLSDRMVPRRTRPLGAGWRGPVLFNAGSSASLVAALVRTVHVHERDLGRRVGRGWSLSDLPSESDALFGGLFDDACFPTRPTPLAGEGRIVGRLAGEGHYRRASFRDRPAPAPSHVVVDCGEEPPPGVGLLVSDLRIHPLEPDLWVLGVRGGPLPEGHQAPAALEGHIRISPRKLLQRCLAAIGPSRASHTGVSTGALLFDDLEAC